MPDNQRREIEPPGIQDTKMKIHRGPPTPPPSITVTVNLPYGEDNAANARRTIQAIMNALDGYY
jgi:hypothetical protein